MAGGKMVDDTGIDTFNRQMVGVNRDDLVVMLPSQRMSKREALVHAAWLVALADDSDDNAEFSRVLAAVQGC